MKEKITGFWGKLTLASKIVFVIWTIGSISSMSKNTEEYTPIQVFIIWAFGCFLYVGLAQLISVRYRKKHPKKASSVKITDSPVLNVGNQKPSVDVETVVPCYDTMEGHEFEHFCAKLLKLNGYHNVEVTRGSGDQGIDILAEKDDIKYGIQCKCYSSDIGNKAVQEAFSGKSYYGCHVAVVLTNRHFTRSAKDLADSNHVLLWDREKLEEFIQKANI